MKKFTSILGSLFFTLCCQSQTGLMNYDSASLADSLKTGANAVFRLDEARLDVLSPAKYVLHVHQVITVLNKEGSYHLRHAFQFDKFYAVGDIAINMYNALGLLVDKYSKKNFEVEVAYDGISLITDDKVMRLITPAPSYPCTIDVKYEIRANSYIELPDWYLNTNNTSTELFRYTVSVPTNLDIRYRSVNFDLVPSVQTENSKKVYAWEAKNIKADKNQRQGGYRAAFYYKRVEVAPNLFEYDGYQGRFTSWSDFGKWNFPLYQEKNPFTESRRNDIKALVANYHDTKEKITILYDYLKKNMRYVSIQFGIGGFRPFGIKYVDEKKYGDCKALTNYMRYLLDVVGIKAYPALVNAGNESPPVDPLFPSSSFNHVILCVPDKLDTVWLECTSKDLEAGFLGTFTENKNALLLTENGGILTKTPPSKAANNFLSTHTEIFIDEQGGAKAFTHSFSTGDIAQEFSQINKMEADDQKEIFINHFNYKSADFFKISAHKDSAGGETVQLNFEFEKWYAFKAGDKYFFPQKLNTIFYEDLKDEKRSIDFLFDYPYEKTDTTVIFLPQDFAVQELPASDEMKTDFAYYKKQIIRDPSGKITVITLLSLKKHVIPAELYKMMQTFFTKVKEHEDQNFVIKKS